MRHAILHGDAGAAQQVDHIRRDADAGIFDELEGFVEDAFDEWLVEQLEFRSHVVHSTISCRDVACYVSAGSACEPYACDAAGRDVAATSLRYGLQSLLHQLAGQS